MHPFVLLLAAAEPATAATSQDETIVIAAEREPVAQDDTPASSTIITRDEIERIGAPLAGDLLRLVPGVAVSVSGPAGSQTQVRIRGAEANHTLLFVDGIRFNDPAAGNEARFELLTSDSLSRIEVVRGPQSALWGSEALGGVVAVDTADARRAPATELRGEYGSLDTARASAVGAVRIGDFGVAASGGWIRSDGMDSFGDGGDRDGFSNRDASLKAAYSPYKNVEFGIVGHWVQGRTEFDGLDPVTFVHADTRDATLNRIAAGRAWGKLGWGSGHQWTLSFGASLLDSSNRNRLARQPLNSTFGRRVTFDAQLTRELDLAGADQRITIAAEHDRERFRTQDQQYFGAADQNRTRNLTAVAAELRSQWSAAVVTDLAVRHDSFSDFADATTFRGSLLVRFARNWTVHAAYGEGIAQPTFYDLFGFFPGSFVGNPDLKPERSEGWEAGLHWAAGGTRLGVTYFDATLKDEIVETFSPVDTTANAAGRSPRHGIEVEGEQRIGEKGMLSLSYTWLDAKQRTTLSLPATREVRRPRHSATLAASLPLGRMELGASLAYVGRRTDTDFDSFPARTVKLGDYLLGSLDLGLRLARGVSAYARLENGFGARYQDAFGYRTAGRTVHAGLRYSLGR